MSNRVAAGLALCTFLMLLNPSAAPDAAAADYTLRAASETTARGFEFPESVAYDPDAKLLYVGQFGGAKLNPAAKDGKGRISKVSLDGKVIEDHFLPGRGDVMNKPKGIWVKGNRLWVADIDSVWVFDTETRKGRKRDLPGIEFANDTAVVGNTLYVSDNRSDKLFRVEPADFLTAASEPKVTVVYSGEGIHPNGLYPSEDAVLLMAGFKSDKEPRGIYTFNAKGGTKAVTKDIGRLDGLYQMKDGTVLATDWNSGTLFAWSEKTGEQRLASGFKGPADFCVVPNTSGYTVVVPDLVKSELRFVQLSR